MKTVDDEIEDLDIDSVKTIKDLINIVELLKIKNAKLETINKKNNLDKLEKEKWENIIDAVKKLLDSMIFLCNNSVNSIKKEKYIKNNIYNCIIHPGKKSKSKKKFMYY